METALWISPALCGCEIEITAQWIDAVIENGHRVSYRRPIPNTIQSMTIVNVCQDHQQFVDWKLPKDPFFGRKGEFVIPIKPSQAQYLYLYHSRFNGQLNYLHCGCRCSELIDANTKEMKLIEHRIYTNRCPVHQADTDHSQARGENKLLNDVLIQVSALYPSIKIKVEEGEGITFVFDKDRNLILDIPELNSEKVTLQNVLDTTFNGKVKLN